MFDHTTSSLVEADWRLRNRPRDGFVLSWVITKSLFFLKGAFWKLLDTFPSVVCFLISIVAWKLLWSLFGFLYGIYKPTSNQVFSLPQMLAICQTVSSFDTLRLNSETWIPQSFNTVLSLFEYAAGSLFTPFIDGRTRCLQPDACLWPGDTQCSTL